MNLIEILEVTVFNEHNLFEITEVHDAHQYAQLLAQARLKAAHNSNRPHDDTSKKLHIMASDRRWIHALKLGLLSDDEYHDGGRDNDNEVEPSSVIQEPIEPSATQVKQPTFIDEFDKLIDAEEEVLVEQYEQFFIETPVDETLPDGNELIESDSASAPTIEDQNVNLNTEFDLSGATIAPTKIKEEQEASIDEIVEIDRTTEPYEEPDVVTYKETDTHSVNAPTELLEDSEETLEESELMELDTAPEPNIEEPISILNKESDTDGAAIAPKEIKKELEESIDENEIELEALEESNDEQTLDHADEEKMISGETTEAGDQQYGSWLSSLPAIKIIEPSVEEVIESDTSVSEDAAMESTEETSSNDVKKKKKKKRKNIQKEKKPKKKGRKSDKKKKKKKSTKADKKKDKKSKKKKKDISPKRKSKTTEKKKDKLKKKDQDRKSKKKKKDVSPKRKSKKTDKKKGKLKKKEQDKKSKKKKSKKKTVTQDKKQSKKSKVKSVKKTKKKDKKKKKKKKKKKDSPIKKKKSKKAGKKKAKKSRKSSNKPDKDKKVKQPKLVNKSNKTASKKSKSSKLTPKKKAKAKKNDTDAALPFQDRIVNSLLLNDTISSETLAQLLTEHGHLQLARQMYERLSVKYPEKSSYFAAQIQQLNLEE